MPKAIQNAAPAASVIDMDALDAVLATVEVDGGEPEVVTEFDELELAGAEETVMETSGVLDEDELRDLEIAVERQEAYEAQDSTPIATVEKQATPAKPARKPRGTATASSSPKTRVPRDINTVADEFFVLTGDVAAMSDEEKAEAKTATLKLIPTQVKIAEKFENLFTALSVKKEPSTYTMIAFRLLDQKGSITSGDLVGCYKASGLGEGTSRSQTGQMMALFNAVGIASRSGQTLTLNPDSVLADRLRNLGAAPAPAAEAEPVAEAA